MSDDQFTKLFKYMQKEFGAARNDFDTRFSELKGDINRIYALFDADAKRTETDEQERLAISHQLGRHEGWIKQLSKTTKTKLVPEALATTNNLLLR